ncbi:MAG TPA: exo-beta-N-acetylmuramidase NamZ domain-containing protein [Vicinamibacterales bacterium]|nr:exo-beta-N-acetylmuramidase NamZ domain-containing protein [Vicinamibacterales bacterium]
MRGRPRLAALGFAAAFLLTSLDIALPAQAPASPRAGLDLARLDRIDTTVEQAIAEGQLPGAVVLVGRGDDVVWRKAYGLRAALPSPEPMTLDTIFDLASLTKVVATTTAVMMLVEDGRLRLSDRVADRVPGFERHGKGRITIRDLLTHMSGLRPDVDLDEPWVGYDEAIALAIDEVPADPPGRRFVYSDIGFFVLADIVSRLEGRPFDVVARERIFEPAGMRETMFRPPASLAGRIAPTQVCTEYGWPCDGPDMRMLRGVVHDPTARRMQGVAGHAGLFSTADDLARFARLLLGGGAIDGTRLLSPLAVARMTSPSTPEGEPAVRGLGWDLDSAFSSNRGELLPLGSFGHTGFTGTSIWIDPATGLFVVFLSNRVHPDGKGDVTALRARVATLAASALVDAVPAGVREAGWSRPAASAVSGAATTSAVRTGIDVLAARGFADLRGRRVVLLTNHTGITHDGRTTIDVLASAPGVALVALMSPEHGIRGVLDAAVPSTRDEVTGLAIHSLYGETRRPTGAMLEGADTIVVDLQDIGTRFYTYMTSMAYVLEEAARRGLKVIVLDRPNPIGGRVVEGPTLDEDAVGFTGYLPAMPVRHGLTMGELARLFNGERGIGADLTVVPMTGWRREQWFDQTSLLWVNPSPNMRNLHAATLYPGLGAFEQTNISVGRGTDTPFEQVGAPWIDGIALASALNARSIPGVRFYPVRFTPSASRFAGEACGGVFIVITDRTQVSPVRVGVEIASALARLHGPLFEVEVATRLFGSAADLARLRAGADPASLAAGWRAGERRWRQLSARHILYQ